jgi:hypothetical protein
MSVVADSTQSMSQTTPSSRSRSFLQAIRRATRSQGKGSTDNAVSSPEKSGAKFTTVAAGSEHEVSPKSRSFNIFKRLESSLHRSSKNSTPTYPTPSTQTPRTRPDIPDSLVAGIFAPPLSSSITSAPPPSNLRITSPSPPQHRPATQILLSEAVEGAPQVTPSRTPLGTSSCHTSLDRLSLTLNDVEPHRVSFEVRHWAQSSSHSDSHAGLDMVSPRDLTPTLSSSPSTSSVETSAQEHQELLRAAASLLCRELGRSAAQFKGNGFTDKECEELQLRMRNLVHLERTWGGPQGLESNVLAVQERDRRVFTEALRDGYVLCQYVQAIC